VRILVLNISSIQARTPASRVGDNNIPE
jgi:hypothetical protein